MAEPIKTSIAIDLTPKDLELIEEIKRRGKEKNMTLTNKAIISLGLQKLAEASTIDISI